MVSDLFSLIGLQCCDPTMRRSQQKGFWNPRVRPPFRARQKCASSAVHTNNVKGNSSTNISTNNSNLILTNDESCLLRHTKEEYDRRGGWVRIFPTPDTWDVYSSYLEFSSSLNHLLHQNLFSDGTKSRSHLKAYPTAVKQRIEHLSSFPNQQMSNRLQNDHALLRANQRTRQYERKLICLIRNMKQEKPTLNCARSIANSTGRRITAIKGTAQLAETTKQNERFKNVDSGLSKCNNQVTDLIAMLKNGLKMSKSQARFAFSSYLTCIKERLMVDNGDQYENGFDAINEQMELVMRFLQRAANSLQTPLNIAISSKLSFSVKRQTLVEKLHEFIEVYNKETEDVNGQMELCLPYPEDDSNFVNDKLFHDFIANATENELEEVLTVFTKINKSAGIFLRSSSQNSREQHLLCGRHKIKSQARSKIHSQEKVQHGLCIFQTVNNNNPIINYNNYSNISM